MAQLSLICKLPTCGKSELLPDAAVPILPFWCADCRDLSLLPRELPRWVGTPSGGAWIHWDRWLSYLTRIDFDTLDQLCQAEPKAEAALVAWPAVKKNLESWRSVFRVPPITWNQYVAANPYDLEHQEDSVRYARFDDMASEPEPEKSEGDRLVDFFFNNTSGWGKSNY